MENGSVMRKLFIDPETGEYVSGQEIFEAVSSETRSQARYDWLKLYPKLLPKLQGLLKSKSFDVVMYCLSQMKYATNEFSGSRTQISVATGVAPATVNRVFDGLLAADIIRHVGGSTWMVNPAVIHGGKKVMDVILSDRYCQLKVNKKAADRIIGDEPEVRTALRAVIENMLEGDEQDDDDE